MIYRILGKYLIDSDAIRDRVGAAGVKFGNAERGATGEFIVLEVLGGEVHEDLQGEIGVEETMVQVSCYSSDPHKAETLGRLVRNRLSGKRGVVTYLADDGTEATTLISAHRRSPTMPIDDPLDASDQWRYASVADYLVFFNSSVPTHA